MPAFLREKFLALKKEEGVEDKLLACNRDEIPRLQTHTFKIISILPEAQKEEAYLSSVTQNSVLRN